MALDTTALPYGVRDIKLTPINADGTLGTPVDLPVARTLSFTDSVGKSDVLRGDDQAVASQDEGTTVNWSLESGGLPFEAIKIMAGGTVTTSGTTPSQTKILDHNIADSRPYFRIEGQIISNSGGDVHVIIPRCKATGDIKGDFKEGAFFLTQVDGDGYPLAVAQGTLPVGLTYRFIQNQTTAAIATS